MRFGDMTLGQLARALAGRKVRIGDSSWDESFEKVLDDWAEAAMVAAEGNLRVFSDGAIAEYVQVGASGSGVIRLTLPRRAEAVAVFVENKKLADAMLENFEQEHGGICPIHWQGASKENQE